MSLLANVLLAVVVLALVMYEQLRARPLGGRRAYTVPLVLAVVGIAQGGLVDDAHPALSIALLAGEAVAAVAVGVLRAVTVRLWRGNDGALWRRGTPWTLGAWLLTLAVRVAFIGAGDAAGIEPATGTVLLFLSVTLLVQNLIVGLRARRLGGSGPVSVVP
ncbi:hypothetical protein E1293_12420 [Actinomadura darangshiensis]|uniref:DUF1453 domain-containing protein n=1 Tax=Actinomadura darangshiensis TaxID=705336 RepID=A0A4R5BLM7_9ACTN|nr:hypothetical protein [Actinomadura darangshiensis]TDD84774.1 hypothetical protein E1293_12420 [Actinomadura darangshiensis]